MGKNPIDFWRTVVRRLKPMGKLGVKISNTDEQNIEIIREKFQADAQTTITQVRFLIVCWKGEHRDRARRYFQTIMAWAEAKGIIRKNGGKRRWEKQHRKGVAQ